VYLFLVLTVSVGHGRLWSSFIANDIFHARIFLGQNKVAHWYVGAGTERLDKESLELVRLGLILVVALDLELPKKY
jgi:hypothetical protein